MARTDPPQRRDVQWHERDEKRDRKWHQRSFRRTTRQALDQQDEVQGERRWRRTSGWLSH